MSTDFTSDLTVKDGSLSWNWMKVEQTLLDITGRTLGNSLMSLSLLMGIIPFLFPCMTTWEGKEARRSDTKHSTYVSTFLHPSSSRLKQQVPHRGWHLAALHYTTRTMWRHTQCSWVTTSVSYLSLYDESNTSHTVLETLVGLQHHEVIQCKTGSRGTLPLK